jgi:hypothetical protein
MKLHDDLIKLKGVWRFQFFDGEKEYDSCGRVRNPILIDETYENLITTVGKQQVLDRLFGLSAVAALANTGVGTSATAAAITDTTLTGGVYKAFASTPTRTALVVTATTSFLTSEANISINEAALTTASPGIMFNRLAPIGPFAKSTAVSLDITTTITQS